jgi:hypothetical protein
MSWMVAQNLNLDRILACASWSKILNASTKGQLLKRSHHD